MNEKSSFKSNSEKYNIAWFKLAEFVSRGEKERALGLYKLLTLSINDPALVLQLEGDILLSFNDGNAIQKYIKAAKLYQQENRLIEAVALYEHLIILNPECAEFYSTAIIDLYKDTIFNLIKNNEAQTIIFDYTKKVVDRYFKNNDPNLHIFISKIETLEPNLHAEILIYLKTR